MLTIKDHSGMTLLALEPGRGSRRVYTLMKEDYITLCFSLAQPRHFGIGSYVDAPSLSGEGTERYELTSPYQPSQNAGTGGWDYEMQLDAHYIKWKNKIFRYIPENGNAEASWSLTATLATHMGVFLRNLSALGYTFNAAAYDCAIDAASVTAAAKPLTYENTSLLDALYKMAEAFECEVWVEDNIIHFGRCEFGEAVDFSQDINVESMTAENSRTDYATRIYAFGSERNIPKSYRPASAQLTVAGVVQRRLMLPEGTPYIDSAPGLSTVEAVEQVIIFDDIYPRTETAIADVSTCEKDVEGDDGTPTGEKWKAYRFTIPGFTFSKDYILPDEDLQAVFQTGSLAGMTFAVKFNPLGEAESDAEAQLYEIIRNDDYGRDLPDETLHPSDGDKIVLIGWDSTKIASLGLVEAAELELKAKAEAEIEKLKIDPANYRCKIISATMFDSGGIWHEYTVGSRVTLHNAGCFVGGSRESRIIGFEYDLTQPCNSPVYIVGEKYGSTRTEALESKVESITLAGQTYSGSSGSGVYVIRTNDSTPPTNANVYSALRTKADFLSRSRDDVALGKILFNRGFDSAYRSRFLSDAQFGRDFISGIAGGIGGNIDASAHAELESLTLRSWLEVPEIRFNRATVLLGDQWQAPGGGIIESVQIDTVGGVAQRTGTIELKLEEGEIGAIAVGDICKGYFHDFAAQSNNATADTDDSRGNTTFSGFCTVYFWITEILSADGSNKRARYMLRPESERWPHSFHPYQAMNFVAYGNFDDTERQKSAYQTRSYTRYLMGVDDWEFRQQNIAMQFGDLSNLQIFGLNMTGYSAYLQNIYMTGTIEHVDIEAPYEMQISTSTGDYFLADGESLTLVCTVKKAWEDLTDYAQSWEITRDSGDTAADAQWNASHTMTLPRFTLTQADVGASILNASALFTLTAYGDGWSASKTVAVRTLRLPTTLSMRFISEYGEYDTFISYGDTVQFRAVIEDGLRNDYTADYDQWSIVRHNGDSADDIASDGVWNVTRAAISASGVFSIEWSAEHDDLQAERATFVVTAQKGAAASTQVTGTLSI